LLSADPELAADEPLDLGLGDSHRIAGNVACRFLTISTTKIKEANRPPAAQVPGQVFQLQDMLRVLCGLAKNVLRAS
jgi:hypothetical protein